VVIREYQEDFHSKHTITYVTRKTRVEGTQDLHTPTFCPDGLNINHVGECEQPSRLLKIRSSGSNPETEPHTDPPSGGAYIEPAENADVCAYLGCRETEGLYHVVAESGERVLCADHMTGWLD